MKLTKFFSITVGAALIFGCSPKAPKVVELALENPLIGLASPIRLQLDTTVVNLQDYFLNTDSIKDIRISSNMTFTFSADKKLIYVVGTPTTKLGSVTINYSGIEYSIPFFASKKTSVHYTFNPQGAAYKSLKMKGDFNGWTESRTELTFNGTTWETTLTLNPAEYSFQLVADGNAILDESKPKRDNGNGGFNSVLTVGDIHPIKPQLVAADASENSFVVHISNGHDNVAAYWQNILLDSNFVHLNGDSLHITLPKNIAAVDRSFVRVFASNDKGISNDLLLPLSKGKAIASAEEITRFDKHAYRMYFLMVDRFADGDSTNNHPVNDPEILPKANYFGGDMAGVIQQIDNGYFEKMGMNTIWLSPIAQNPLDAWGLWKTPKSKFSGYHGYWPISSSEIDFRFGDKPTFESLIDKSHNKNMNVLIDYVANHVHQSHPLMQQHPDWTTPLYLPDGTMNTERWDEYRLTTWFDTFMPTLDLERPEVSEAMTDSALFWVKNYKIDGFRHDATKHIPELFWRMLTYKMKSQIVAPEHRDLYQIGETYGNAELISSYVCSGQMDAQFDFNVYDAAVSAFGKNEGSFLDLHRVLSESFDYYGYHNLMGYITGNQDRTRFISYADGAVKFNEDPKLAGWTRTISNQGEIGYQRLGQLVAFISTIPGIPVIYYGDEIGMPGANDPDNRRMMLFDKLTPEQENQRQLTANLFNFRKTNLALTYGETYFLTSEKDTWAYARKYLNQQTLVVFNRAGEEQDITLDLPDYLNRKEMRYFDANKTVVPIGNTVTLKIPAHSFAIIYN